MIHKGYIYCVTCLPTGKLYFGQTIRLIEERWNRHVNESFSGSRYKFHRAIRKYGEENFIVEEVLTVSAPTKEILKKKLDYVEMRLIKRFNTFRNGYNMTLGVKDNLERYFLRNQNEKCQRQQRKDAHLNFGKESLC